MSVLPINTPSTPRDVKATQKAIHTLSRDIRKIRRDIKNRRVDHVSEAKRIAALKESQITELRANLRNSPVVKRSVANKYRRYRVPVNVRRPRTRMRRRRVPLKRSIQASIASKNNRLVQSKAAKPFNVSKKPPKAPKVKRIVRRTPRRGYVRRMPQSPVRSARKVIRRPMNISRMMKKASRRTPSPSMRRALTQESKVQASKSIAAQQQLAKNRQQSINARRAKMIEMMRQRRKQLPRPAPKPDPRDASRITKRIPSRQTYVIRDKSGRPRRVPKSIYDRYMAAQKAMRDRNMAMKRKQPVVTKQYKAPTPVIRRPTPSRPTFTRPSIVSKFKPPSIVSKFKPPSIVSKFKRPTTPTSRRFNPVANKALLKVREEQARKDKIEAAKKAQSQRSMMEKLAERRRLAAQKSSAISQNRLNMLKSNIAKSRNAAILQAKELEKHLADIRAKKESVNSRLSPIKKRVTSFRKSFRLGEANLGEIRRNDTLADNHRYNMQELGKLESEAASLGSISRRLKQQEMLVQNQLQLVSDQIGSMNAQTLYRENKQNLSDTKYLEKCLSDKLMALNQRGDVSGEGIQKAKAIIRQFDKRQIPMAKAKRRIYRTLKANFTPKGGDMLKPDVSGLTEAIQMSRMQLASQGKEFSPKGDEKLRKLVNKYSVGQIKTRAEAESQLTKIIHNPRYVQQAVTTAQLNQTRALGIAANIRSRMSRQLPGVRKLTAERRAFYERQRIAEEERLKASQEKVNRTQSLAGFFPRTRSAMERLVR